MAEAHGAMLTHLRTIERSLLHMSRAVGGLVDIFQMDGAAEKGEDAAALEDLARTEAIEAVLRVAGGPLSPVQIWAQLHDAGREDPKMEVQVTTYDLWRRGRIDKIGRGIYVAKEHRPVGVPSLKWIEP